MVCLMGGQNNVALLHDRDTTKTLRFRLSYRSRRASDNAKANQLSTRVFETILILTTTFGRLSLGKESNLAGDQPLCLDMDQERRRKHSLTR